MSLVPKMLFFVLIVVGTSRSVLAVDALPRLWEVTGKNQQGESGKFYILPVTHNGLAAEHDEYFFKTVLPVAMSVDTFLHEASRLLPSDAPACPIPLADTRENRDVLEKAHFDVERALFDIIPAAAATPGESAQHREQSREASRIFAHSITKSLSEYGMILSMESYLSANQNAHPERRKKLDADYLSRPEIAHYIAYRRRDEKKANASIDEKYDNVNAYCSIGKERLRYLQRRLALTDPMKFKYPSKEEIGRMNAGYIEAVREGHLNSLLMDAMDGYGDEAIVCGRNDKWFARMLHDLNRGVRFYALGAAHVLQPALNHPDRCDGLLLRLQKAGFTVSVVK